MNALNLTGAVRVSETDAAKMLRETGGKFFRVDFIKRTTGTERRMVARTGVKKGVAMGGPKRTKPEDNHLIVVWDAGVQDFRSIAIEGIRGFRIKGTTYAVV